MALSPTANQTARPNPAYSNAAKARMSQNRSPQSGGDIGGSKGFLKGKGIPTSGGSSKSHFLTDRTNDQGGKKLYLGKAYENAQRPKPTRVSGNSEGAAETHSKTETDAHVKRAAAGRVSKAGTKGKVNSKATTPRFGPPSSRTFGPVVTGNEGNVNG